MNHLVCTSCGAAKSNGDEKKKEKHKPYKVKEYFLVGESKAVKALKRVLSSRIQELYLHKTEAKAHELLDRCWDYETEENWKSSNLDIETFPTD